LKIYIVYVNLIIDNRGGTYAVFTYTKLGTTENTVTAGALKFLYTENTGVGAGILLEDALPVADAVGKEYATEGKVFDFSIVATNTSTDIIPYEVTLRKKSTSTLPENAVKVYLTDMTEDTDSELLAPTLYSSLVQTNVEVGEEIEKTIYTDGVTGNTNNYTKNFRLRMWVDEAVDFSNDSYTGKTFTATVNIYSNVPLISEEEINLRENTDVSKVSTGDTELTTVEGKDYQYQTSLPEGTTETTIDIETENPNSTVTIEKVDSLAYNSNTIERMATTKTLPLTAGVNYFKVTVTSQNKQKTDTFNIRINVNESTTIFGKKFEVITAEPTLTTSSNNTSDASGLYKSTDTNDGRPTYYFRGNVENNYVSFAGFTWRIVRINEDGTIKLIKEAAIDSTLYMFKSTNTDVKYMYYSNSDVKTQLTTWNNTNILTNYSNYVATGDYYCEQARVKNDPAYTSGSAVMKLNTGYTPTFKCETDGNGYGIVNSNIGLLTYDEVVYAGGYVRKENSNYYLHNINLDWWMISPAGFKSDTPYIWRVQSTGSVLHYAGNSTSKLALRPVINLKADTTATGSGVEGDEFVVQ